MATTVRLPEDLQNEATRYAQGLGLSLNGIIAVALRDYLDQRKPGGASAATLADSVADPMPQPVQPRAVKTPVQRVEAVIVAPANRRAKCPCGSGKRYSQCHARESVSG